MGSNPHVIVVGAGVVGASIAWHLVHHGAHVTIVAPEVGGTATTKSFSWLNATWRNPRPYYDFRRRSLDAWKRLTQEIPALRPLVRWRGALQWDMPADELAEFEQGHAAWGYDIRRVERKEMQELEPSIRHELLPDWGLHIGEEGTVEAAAAASIMVADAQARGARLVSIAVRSLLQGTDGVHGIVLETGEEMRADHVVLAAGLGSVQLCASVGVDLPLTGSRALLVQSKPVAKSLLTGIVLSPGLHIRQTVDGHLLAGAGYAGSDPGGQPEQTATELFAKVKRLFVAEISNDMLQQESFTIGVRPMPSDGFPILGSAGIEGLTVAAMHSGVTLAAIVGELLADMVYHGKMDPALERYSLRRFG